MGDEVRSRSFSPDSRFNRFHVATLRTIQQSHRPRVSDRIMCCHSLIDWTTIRLSRFRNEWRRHKRIWIHKGEKAVFRSIRGDEAAH
jgi:hypothetical protein